MKEDNKILSFFRHFSPRRWILVWLIGALIATAIPAYAWFYYERRIAAAAMIDTPRSIHINAGPGDDEVIEYLDLSGINAADHSHFQTVDGETCYYKDFVFYIKGENITQYRLQLAYTTNNQYTYYVYKANSVSSSSAFNVYYELHDSSGTKVYLAEGARINGDFINLNAEGEIQAARGDNRYYKGADKTYETDDTVNRYAMPLYWQSESISTGLEGLGAFEDAYILRVLWDEHKENNKETDIIYIAARAG